MTQVNISNRTLSVCKNKKKSNKNVLFSISFQSLQSIRSGASFTSAKRADSEATFLIGWCTCRFITPPYTAPSFSATYRGMNVAIKLIEKQKFFEEIKNRQQLLILKEVSGEIGWTRQTAKFSVFR